MLEFAFRAAELRRAPLRVVHAWHARSSGSVASVLSSGRPQYYARRALRGAVDRLNERYPQLYIAAEQVHEQPGPALLSEAENAELLVIGSQGFGGVGGFFSGSVALATVLATVARVERPVVLVRAGDTAEDEHLPDSSGKPSVCTPCRDVVVAVDVDGGGPCALPGVHQTERQSAVQGFPGRPVGRGEALARTVQTGHNWPQHGRHLPRPLSLCALRCHSLRWCP